VSVEQSTAHAKEISEDAEIGKLLEEIERDNAVVRARREKALIQDWKEVEENIVKQRTAYEEEEIRMQELTSKEIEVQLVCSLSLGFSFVPPCQGHIP